MPETRRNPPIKIHIFGSRDTVPRVVTMLREVLDVTYTTPTHDADFPYEAHRYVGAADLRGNGMPSAVAEIRAVMRSWERGNTTPDGALAKIQAHLERLA
jgi:hypothetical protein